MHILPVLAGLEVLVLGGGPDIFFFVHLNCASNVSPRSSEQWQRLVDRRIQLVWRIDEVQQEAFIVVPPSLEEHAGDLVITVATKQE